MTTLLCFVSKLGWNQSFRRAQRTPAESIHMVSNNMKTHTDHGKCTRARTDHISIVGMHLSAAQPVYYFCQCLVIKAGVLQNNRMIALFPQRISLIHPSTGQRLPEPLGDVLAFRALHWLFFHHFCPSTDQNLAQLQKNKTDLGLRLQKTLASEAMLALLLYLFYWNQYQSKLFSLYSLFPLDGVQHNGVQDTTEGFSSSGILAVHF